MTRYSCREASGEGGGVLVYRVAGKIHFNSYYMKGGPQHSLFFHSIGLSATFADTFRGIIPYRVVSHIRFNSYYI